MILADDPRLQMSGQIQNGFNFVTNHPTHGDTGPVTNNRGDRLSIDGGKNQRGIALLSIQLVLQRLQLAQQLIPFSSRRHRNMFSCIDDVLCRLISRLRRFLLKFAVRALYSAYITTQLRSDIQNFINEQFLSLPTLFKCDIGVPLTLQICLVFLRAFSHVNAGIMFSGYNQSLTFKRLNTTPAILDLSRLSSLTDGHASTRGIN